MLMMMEDVFPDGLPGHNTATTLHTMIDAMRLAYADRGLYMADNDFVAMPLQGLLDPDYVASRAALIDPNGNAIPTVTAGTPPGPWEGGAMGSGLVASTSDTSEEGGETTHFVAADRLGNVVTWTTTIESGWGSGIMVPGYGFMLNNEMTDFDSGTTAANRIETGLPKRPRSSMTPTLLLKDGVPWMATGSPGGATIINTVFQMVMNVVDHGMTIQEAVDAARISHTSASRTANTSWESRGGTISPEVRAELRARGHVLPVSGTTIGSAQSLVIDLQTGHMFGAGDDRRNGTVIYVKGAVNQLKKDR
jgi:gamma-glutamyltranspeptidase / glutathione hydrolase